MTQRALLIGASGQLGSELHRQGGTKWDITAPGRLDLDASDPEALNRAVENLRPNLVLNCSAFHVLARCESHFGDALLVNAVAVSTLAKAAERIGARFVTVSTDYAFDGTSGAPYREDDATNPIQAYGISKVAGERAALAAHPEGTFVIRSCGLYGHAPSRQKAGNFVLNRLSDARTRNVVEIGSDLVCTPTSARDLATAMLVLIADGAPAGLYHLTNGGQCDWASFTAEIYRLADIRTMVQPVDRGGHYPPVRRPAYSVLDNEKAKSVGINLRPWQDALAEYVGALDLAK